MGVKTALRKYWQEDSFAVLLDSLTTACAVNAGSSPVARAISQAVPGTRHHVDCHTVVQTPSHHVCYVDLCTLLPLSECHLARPLR